MLNNKMFWKNKILNRIIIILFMPYIFLSIIYFFSNLISNLFFLILNRGSMIGSFFSLIIVSLSVITLSIYWVFFQYINSFVYTYNKS